MIIDIHSHVVAPSELYAYQSVLMGSRGAHGKHKLNISDERLLNATFSLRPDKTHLELLDDVGTDIQFISPRPFQMIHSVKPESIVHWYTEAANDVIARICELLPNRFRGIAGLPQSPGVSPVHCLEELERCVKELGFIGCIINPDPHEGIGASPGLGDEFWYPLYEKLVELDIPAIVHSASCQSSRVSYSLHFINEESTAIMSLLESNVFSDFPKLKMIISHGGGAIPYQIGRFQAPRYRKKEEYFEDSMRKLYFDTVLYTKDALELLFKTVGTDRCLFGTENPGNGSSVNPFTGKYMDDLKPTIESIDWLTDRDKKMIFEENARALFKI